MSGEEEKGDRANWFDCDLCFRSVCRNAMQCNTFWTGFCFILMLWLDSCMKVFVCACACVSKLIIKARINVEWLRWISLLYFVSLWFGLYMFFSFIFQWLINWNTLLWMNHISGYVLGVIYNNTQNWKRLNNLYEFKCKINDNFDRMIFKAIIPILILFSFSPCLMSLIFSLCVCVCEFSFFSCLNHSLTAWLSN